jgi:predicted membrane channel-forming protein YqfA (hemolysin III family)
MYTKVRVVRLFPLSATFYVSAAIFAICMIGYALADKLRLLPARRRLKREPIAYLLIGTGLLVIALARLVDQAYPFQGDSLVMAAGGVCLAWGAIVYRRERVD